MDVPEDALADGRVLLHLSAFVERERAGLFEEARRQPDLADVVDETAEVRVLLHLRGQPHSLGDVARVDGDGSGVTRRVPIPRVERRDEGGGELEVRALERLVGGREVSREASLFLVEAVEALSGCRRHEEQGERPRRDFDVHECEECHDGA